MNIKSLIILILIIFYTLPFCGIPSQEEAEEDLNTPLGLVLINRDNSGITIEWTGYNKERYFTGYNVYMTDESTSDTTLISKSQSHISNDNRINTDIERQYIVFNEELDFPTVKYDFGPYDIPQRIRFTITRGPGNLPINTQLSYTIGVTAYDRSSVVESHISNVIVVPTSID